MDEKIIGVIAQVTGFREQFVIGTLKTAALDVFPLRGSMQWDVWLAYRIILAWNELHT